MAPRFKDDQVKLLLLVVGGVIALIIALNGFALLSRTHVGTDTKESTSDSSTAEVSAGSEGIDFWL